MSGSGEEPVPPTDPVERRVRGLLRAYPWRVRAEQGDEIVATVLDALPAGARRLPIGTAIDLVRGGWRVRARRRPPWPTVLAYGLGFRIHPRWIWWVYDDLERPDYVRVKRRRTFGINLLVFVAMAILVGDLMILLIGMGASVGGLFGIPRDRERRRARYGLLPGGSDPSAVWVQSWTGRLLPNLPVARLLVAVGGPVAVAAAVALAAVIDDPLEEGGVRPSTDEVVATVRPYAVVGVVIALLAAMIGMRLARRVRRGPSVSRRAGRAASLTAGVVVLVLTYLGLVMASNLWATPAEVSYAGLAVVLGPVGLVVALLGMGLAVVGRRRGAPVGLWDVVPAVGPRHRVRPVNRGWAAQVADVEPWTPEVDRSGSGVRHRDE